jgi:transcriptional regulator with XRE-family HTH domain
MTKKKSLKLVLLDAIRLACLNQREIAAKTGLTPATLSNWRTGHRNPSPQHALNVALRLRAHAQQVEHAAIEVVRLAEEEQRRKGVDPGAAIDSETLELFHRGDAEIE